MADGWDLNKRAWLSPATGYQERALYGYFRVHEVIWMASVQ